MKYTNGFSKSLTTTLLLTLILLFGHFLSIHGQSQTNSNSDSQSLSATPIFDEAFKAFNEKDYKKAAELGLYSATHEDLENKDFHRLAYRWTAGADVLNNDVEKAFEHLEKVFSLGYGENGECVALERDSNLEVLHNYPKWNSVINSCYRNFFEFVKSNGDSPEVLLLKVQDQANRFDSKITFSVLLANDTKRRAKMKRLLTTKKVKTFLDYHSAALIFQHSGNSNDIKLARILAEKRFNLQKPLKILAEADNSLQIQPTAFYGRRESRKSTEHSLVRQILPLRKL